MTFFIVIGLLGLLYAYLKLSERVTRLDERLQRFEVYDRASRTAPASVETDEMNVLSQDFVSVPPSGLSFTDLATNISVESRPVPPPPPQGTSLYTPVAYQAMAQDAQTETEFFLVTWFKEQTLIKIGAIIFFLGAVWFVSYSITQNWIPSSTPVYLGLCIAVACYAAGVWRKSFEPVQYLVLTTLGTGVVLAAVCSAQFVYSTPLFPAPIALVLMVMSLVYTVRVSIETNTEWLAIVSALAGFWIPFLLGVTTPQILLLVYLFVIAAGLSIVVFFTRWRVLSFVLVMGCSLFEFSAATDISLGHMSAPALWFFMVLFAGLFTTTTTISLYRSATPEAIDIALLTIVGLLYAYGAHTFSALPSLSFFVAALLLAGVGYVLSGMGASKRVVAVYVCFASAVWLLGTGQFFTGYNQLLAFTVEITGAFLLLTTLRLSERAVYISMATFAIPLTISFQYLYSSLWNIGVWQLDAFATTLLAVSLLGSALWVLEQSHIRSEQWALPVAGTIAAFGFLYTLLLLMQIAVSSVAFGTVFGYILWFGFIFVCFYYTLGTRLSHTWSGVVFASMVMPIVLSFKSLASPLWRSSGVMHADALGVYTVIAFGILVTLLCIVSHRQLQDATSKVFAIVATTVTSMYSFIVIAIFWDALYSTNGTLAATLTYCSYAIILYALFTASFKWCTSRTYAYVFTCAGILPVLMSLGSMQLSLWDGSVWQPYAAGLYLMTALMVIMGLRYLTTPTVDEAERTLARRFAVTLFVGAGIYATSIVWLSTHALSPTEGVAIMAALFIYTVAGLGLYIDGSRRGVAALKYSGMSLLAVVVLRLGLFDIRTMEPLWRIVTFLGIGILFMLGALLEKKKN